MLLTIIIAMPPIKSIMENLSSVFGIFASIAIIAGIVTLVFQKKQLHVTTIRHCICDYRTIIRN